MISHLFTSSAFVLRPFAGSPLHFNQNFSSSFFNSEGFRPQSEAPGISFSSRSDAPNVANAAMFVLLWPHWPRSDVVVTILPELSAIMKVVYASVVYAIGQGDPGYKTRVHAWWAQKTTCPAQTEHHPQCQKETQVYAPTEQCRVGTRAALFRGAWNRTLGYPQ